MEPTGRRIDPISLTSATPERTHAIGAALAAVVRVGDVVALGGELGAGKTCITQGIARGLDVAGRVTSPTFVIMREYMGRMPLVHVDAYRLERLNELADIGVEELFRSDAVTVIEWGDRVEGLLPASHLRLELHYTDGEDRIITIDGRGRWVDRLRMLREAIEAIAGDAGGDSVAAWPP